MGLRNAPFFKHLHYDIQVSCSCLSAQIDPWRTILSCQFRRDNNVEEQLSKVMSGLQCAMKAGRFAVAINENVRN